MHNLLVARHVIGTQIFISKKHFKIDARAQARVGPGLVTLLSLISASLSNVLYNANLL